MNRWRLLQGRLCCGHGLKSHCAKERGFKGLWGRNEATSRAVVMQCLRCTSGHKKPAKALVSKGDGHLIWKYANCSVLPFGTAILGLALHCITEYVSVLLKARCVFLTHGSFAWVILLCGSPPRNRSR